MGWLRVQNDCATTVLRQWVSVFCIIMPPAGAFMVQSSRSKSNNDNNNRRHASNESKEENPPFREHKVTLLSAIASASVSSPPTAAAQNDDDNNLLLHLGVPGGDSDKRQTVSSSSAAAIPLELPFLSLEDDKSTIRDEKKLDGDPPSHHLWRHHLANNLYHRDKEVATIVSCYHQSLTAAAEGKPNTPASFLLVSGTMGTGKTRLVHDALAHLVRDKGGYFLVGKHDQLRRPEPYSGLVSAFAEFASQVVDRGSDEVNALRSVICQAVGEEFSVLISMFPALAQIFGDKTDCVMNNAKSTDGIQRFIFVFQLFLQTISSLDRPIVLVLDDLHWTDPCSIDTFCSILSDLKSIPGLFVIGTYDDKLASDVLKRKLSELEHSRIETTRIALQSLDQGEVNHVVGNALQLSRLDLVEDLGRMVHNQAGGNFFYIIEFFQWLQDSELVSFQVETNTWDWDSSEIQMTLDQCHQGHFSTDTFKRLSTDMIEILKVAACLGFQLNQSHVEFVVDRPVSSFLETAVSLHILVVDSGTGNYSFKHDGTQKAVYELIPENGRELFHLEVGRRLWRRLSKDDLEKNIFVVLSQIHIGKRLITREKERYAISSLCLHAGRKAAKSSTFRTATIYLNLAIELLGDRGWYDDYDLTLALYNAAAEMNMCTGSFDSMEANIECVLEKSRNSGDQIQAQSTKIYAMGMMDRQHEAIDLGIQVLASLGVRFPYMKCRRAMKSELCSVQKLVKGKSNEQLMRLPIIEDRTILSGLHILNMVSIRTFLPGVARELFLPHALSCIFLRYT